MKTQIELTDQAVKENKKLRKEIKRLKLVIKNLTEGMYKDAGTTCPKETLKDILEGKK